MALRVKEVEIDIYVPFYSNPGLPAEDLKKFSLSLEGFKTVEKEALAIMKQKALMERRNTVKGRKDLVDLVSLFQLKEFDWQKYKKTVAEYGLEDSLNLVKKTIQKTRAIEELNLNVHQIARLKKNILPWLG